MWVSYDLLHYAKILYNFQQFGRTKNFELGELDDLSSKSYEQIRLDLLGQAFVKPYDHYLRIMFRRITWADFHNINTRIIRPANGFISYDSH